MKDFDVRLLKIKVNGIKLSKKISHWQMEGLNLTFVIGGPDGLSKEFLNGCDFVWSMSDLTFPHPLVRVILLEQLYRAWTITTNHPYHRS